MNYERNRLNTFNNWPGTGAIEPVRIAKAGFFYTGQGVEVQCFSCGGKISEWNYGDQVMVRHRRLDPRCPFVISPLTSGNIPVTEGQSDNVQNGSRNLGNRMQQNAIRIDMSQLQDPNMMQMNVTEEDEMHRNDPLRLLTFIHWPITFISREEMVRAGFYHLGEGRVRCSWCGGELCCWRPGDEPLSEHRRHFPMCPFILSNSQSQDEGTPPLSRSLTPPTPSFTPPLQSVQRDLDSQQQTAAAVHNSRILLGGWRALGVVSGGVEGARHPANASPAARLATYSRWPRGRAQTPEALADAGFFYTGTEDQVRCFYCDGGLGKWEPTDAPWTEHARWFPECGYVLLVKGREFVDRYRERSTTIHRTFSADTGLRLPRHNDNRVHFPVTSTQVEAEMMTPYAIAALGAGLDVARVRRAIMRRLRLTGVGYTSSEALIDAALDEQLNEEPWSASPLNESLSREILNEALIPTDYSRRRWDDQSENTDGSTSPADSLRNTPSNPPAVPQERAPEPPRPETSPARAASSPSRPVTPPRALSLEEENRQLKEARLCKVCMDSEVSVVFLPCGHLVSCAGCGASLTTCPLCRASVRALVRAYLA